MGSRNRYRRGASWPSWCRDCGDPSRVIRARNRCGCAGLEFDEHPFHDDEHPVDIDSEHANNDDDACDELFYE